MSGDKVSLSMSNGKGKALIVTVAIGMGAVGFSAGAPSGWVAAIRSEAVTSEKVRRLEADQDQMRKDIKQIIDVATQNQWQISALLAEQARTNDRLDSLLPELSFKDRLRRGPYP